jgi:hypothetical protein
VLPGTPQHGDVGSRQTTNELKSPKAMNRENCAQSGKTDADTKKEDERSSTM